MNTKLERYLDVMRDQGLYGARGNLRFYTRQLFRDTDLDGAGFLDVGGGSGLFTLYAATCGASKALCLEPELAGSRAKASSTFDLIKRYLGLTHAQLLPRSLDEFEAPPCSFNVILLHASINHLNEWATIHLRTDPQAAAIYEKIARKLHALTAPGGRIILVDCSPANIFPKLGLKNPFAPTIEWHKHQPPEVWASVLAKAGFVRPRIHWPTFNTLGWAGRLLLGNRIGAFLTASTFRLELQRRPEPAS